MPARLLHIVNAARRDARVSMAATRPPDPVRLGVPGHEVRFRRYLATTEAGLDETLTEQLGGRYGEALIDGDPEVDFEVVGRFIERTEQVYLSSAGEVLHTSPEILEVITGPDGVERERRAPKDEPPNVNDEMPVRWTGRKMPKRDVVRRFVFRRTIQLRHVDGLTFDFLSEMARELSDENAMLLVGGGPTGKDPLVFQENGTPHRGFLEGRVDGARYMLLLHLSNMELKRPIALASAATDDGGTGGEEQA